jgi:hypothetical protein
MVIGGTKGLINGTADAATGVGMFSAPFALAGAGAAAVPAIPQALGRAGAAASNLPGASQAANLVRGATGAVANSAVGRGVGTAAGQAGKLIPQVVKNHPVTSAMTGLGGVAAAGTVSEGYDMHQQLQGLQAPATSMDQGKQQLAEFLKQRPEAMEQFRQTHPEEAARMQQFLEGAPEPQAPTPEPPAAAQGWHPPMALPEEAGALPEVSPALESPQPPAPSEVLQSPQQPPAAAGQPAPPAQPPAQPQPAAAPQPPQQPQQPPAQPQGQKRWAAPADVNAQQPPAQPQPAAAPHPPQQPPAQPQGQKRWAAPADVNAQQPPASPGQTAAMSPDAAQFTGGDPAKAQQVQQEVDQAHGIVETALEKITGVKKSIGDWMDNKMHSVGVAVATPIIMDELKGYPPRIQEAFKTALDKDPGFLSACMAAKDNPSTEAKIALAKRAGIGDMEMLQMGLTNQIPGVSPLAAAGMALTTGVDRGINAMGLGDFFKQFSSVQKWGLLLGGGLGLLGLLSYFMGGQNMGMMMGGAGLLTAGLSYLGPQLMQMMNGQGAGPNATGPGAPPQQQMSTPWADPNAQQFADPTSPYPALAP